MTKLLCTSTTCELSDQCFRHISTYPDEPTGEERFVQLEPNLPYECDCFEAVPIW